MRVWAVLAQRDPIAHRYILGIYMTEGEAGDAAERFVKEHPNGWASVQPFTI